MTIKEMQDMVKYGKQSLGDLVMNEDYRQLLIRNVDNLIDAKVWQEQEEFEETGIQDTANINKIFISYIEDNGTASLNSDDTENKIIKTIQDLLYGKPVVVRDVSIKPISVTLTITTTERVFGRDYSRNKGKIFRLLQ